MRPFYGSESSVVERTILCHERVNVLIHFNMYKDVGLKLEKGISL